MHAPRATPTLLPGDDETIVAPATAPGRGAVALVRLSGARAMTIARALGAFGGVHGAAAVPRHATLSTLTHPESGGQLEQALVTWFAAPRSYTGEEVVELAVHGGVVSPSLVVAACLAAGARMALPGEFTRRAVMHGRMDLVQAEAVADLVDARTRAMQRLALSQLDGGLSRRLLALRDDVIHLDALLAYDIDFPEEDDGPIAPARIADAVSTLRTALEALLRTAPHGALVRDGVLVVIAGPPNAGKSSLFNALLGEARAIVTAIPGTTRDAIEALLDRPSLPLRLVDTAGIRDTTDALEQLGIEVSSRYVGQAQVVLACGATDADVQHTVQALQEHTEGVVIPVRTKADVGESAVVLQVSAERGEGLEQLLAAVDAAAVQVLPADGANDALLTRERHRVALQVALDEVVAFGDAWSAGALPAPVAAVHLLAAREAISELIGSVDIEDVLDRVFRDFCIGK
ncbi:MAG: tRNA uridine-5-carboxymethylaminomethyl(34) synthesis GTPase MnmE [Gemmatimonas sp.]|jgi:tRNA modification GTPase|uniref:tRNA uridine-5-carboxymethylaminomethyl(34) synthesis GTPase MnmE n=1 Tax=Gemmatimonas sp. TaxID=1962908 RepID=UPI0031C5CCCF|nr:tRNA uridine-5-carboxymethylaminomethyl(34) synthesis GTPase MnmE [Gemmatimonas sp.]